MPELSTAEQVAYAQMAEMCRIPPVGGWEAAREDSYLRQQWLQMKERGRNHQRLYLQGEFAAISETARARVAARGGGESEVSNERDFIIEVRARAQEIGILTRRAWEEDPSLDRVHGAEEVALERLRQGDPDVLEARSPLIMIPPGYDEMNDEMNERLPPYQANPTGSFLQQSQYQASQVTRSSNSRLPSPPPYPGAPGSNQQQNQSRSGAGR